MAAGETGGTLPQAVGWGFLGLLAIYLRWSVQLARQAKQGSPFSSGEGLPARFRRLASIVAAIVVVLVSSSFLISTATELAVRMEVPSSVVAATLVAFGTSLPELVIVVMATVKGQGALAIGNIIGADILNVLFVAGAAAAVTPEGLAADPHFFVLQFPAMLFVLAVFRVGTLTARDATLRRPFGVTLLAAYVAVTLASYLVS